MEGESRHVARVHAALARQVADRGQPFVAPCVLLSGGETTVTVSGKGQGGRNVEFLVALAQALDGHPRVHALAADTDGVDGSLDIAGACIDPTTPARTVALGRRLADVLADLSWLQAQDREPAGFAFFVAHSQVLSERAPQTLTTLTELVTDVAAARLAAGRPPLVLVLEQMKDEG